MSFHSNFLENKKTNTINNIILIQKFSNQNFHIHYESSVTFYGPHQTNLVSLKIHMTIWYNHRLGTQKRTTMASAFGGSLLGHHSIPPALQMIKKSPVIVDEWAHISSTLLEFELCGLPDLWLLMYIVTFAINIRSCGRMQRLSGRGRQPFSRTTVPKRGMHAVCAAKERQESPLLLNLAVGLVTELLRIFTTSEESRYAQNFDTVKFWFHVKMDAIFCFISCSLETPQPSLF